MPAETAGAVVKLVAHPFKHGQCGGLTTSPVTMIHLSASYLCRFLTLCSTASNSEDKEALRAQVEAFIAEELAHLKLALDSKELEMEVAAQGMQHLQQRQSDLQGQVQVLSSLTAFAALACEPSVLNHSVGAVVEGSNWHFLCPISGQLCRNNWSECPKIWPPGTPFAQVLLETCQTLLSSGLLPCHGATATSGLQHTEQCLQEMSVRDRLDT